MKSKGLLVITGGIIIIGIVAYVVRMPVSDSDDTNSSLDYVDQEVTSEGYSPDQQQLIDSFGPPPRWSVSYMPIGEGGEEITLGRYETWSYPDHEYEIIFLGGDIMDTYAIDPDPAGTVYSGYTPNMFEYEMTYDDVASELMATDIEPVDWLPELYEKGTIESYIASFVTFTLEGGQLTYIETLGLPPL